jgi:hypothetical protein
MSNLPKWYKDELLKYIIKEFDWTFERSNDMLQELDDLNVKYWEHIC